MATGIYSITNSETADCYIGQALDIKKRWAQHRRELNAGDHHNQRLQNDWNTFGEQAFHFEIEQRCKRSELDRLEEKLIDDYGTYNVEKTVFAEISVGSESASIKTTGHEGMNVALRSSLTDEDASDFVMQAVREMDEIVEAHPEVLDNPDLLDSLELPGYHPELVKALKKALQG